MLHVEPLRLPLRMRGTPRNDDGHTKMLEISPLSFFHSNCHWGNAASPLPKCPALCSGACIKGVGCTKAMCPRSLCLGLTSPSCRTRIWGAERGGGRLNTPPPGQARCWCSSAPCQNPPPAARDELQQLRATPGPPELRIFQLSFQHFIFFEVGEAEGNLPVPVAPRVLPRWRHGACRSLCQLGALLRCEQRFWLRSSKNGRDQIPARGRFDHSVATGRGN